MSEEARSGGSEDRPVAMKGEAVYAGGNVQVVATVARGFRRSGTRAAGRVDDEFQRKQRHGRDMDPFNESYSFDYGDSEEAQKEAVQDYIRQAMARRAAGSPMPPVTLSVEFTNRGTEPVEIAPMEVNSDLGNFAPRPKTITVAPGEKAKLEPMVSQLGVTSDAIPVTIGIRVGGKTETQVIEVKNILAPSLRK